MNSERKERNSSEDGSFPGNPFGFNIIKFKIKNTNQKVNNIT